MLYNMSAIGLFLVYYVKFTTIDEFVFVKLI